MAGEGPHAITFPTTSNPHPYGPVLSGLWAIPRLWAGSGTCPGRMGCFLLSCPRERSPAGQGMSTAGWALVQGEADAEVWGGSGWASGQNRLWSHEKARTKQ